MGSVKFFSGFGSVVSPRYTIVRATTAYKLLRGTRRSLSKSASGRFL
jgi:hypothetical protein